MLWMQSHLVKIMFIAVTTDVISAGRVCFFCCCLPMTSSHIFMRNVAKGLSDMGHNVTIVLPKHLFTDKNKYTFTAAEDIWYASNSQEIVYQQQQLLETVDVFGMLNGDAWRPSAEEVLSDNILFEKLKQGHFDLIVLDSFPPQLSIIPYRLALPFVYITPVYDPWTYGIPFSPSFVPPILTPYSDRMNFIQRVMNTFFTITLAVYDPWGDRKALERLAPDMPYISLPELNRKAELWIVQADIILGYPLPTLPNIKMIGGLTVEEAKQLPKRLREFIDSSEDGVIYMSLGSSNIKLPDDVINIFIQTFTTLQYGVIWRTHRAVGRNNILNVSWVPQNDILGNDNIKLFISHCGVNGQHEALYHAVATLCIPLFFDQFYFAERVARKGYGRALDWRSLVQSELEHAIVDLMSNVTYKRNVKRASEIMHSSGILPRDDAAYWIDHVMKYGGSYMRSESQNMTWYEFLLLDVVIVCFAFVLVFVFMLSKIVKCILALTSKVLKNKMD